MRYSALVRDDGALSTEVVRGRAAVLEHRPELIALAERTGQHGLMDHLDYFLHFKDALRKIPYLVLVRRVGGAGVAEHEELNEELVAALLIYEYTLLGCGTGVYATDDVGGRRTLIAAGRERTAMGRRAAEALLRRGARVVFQSFVETVVDEGALEPWSGVGVEAGGSGMWRLATQRRLIRAYLPLEETYDGTLAKLGQHTRRNMRAFRRKAEAQLGCGFVAEARLSRWEFRAFNRETTYAVTDAVAGWRYDAITAVPGGFLCGVQDRTGRWLALAGGRRHGEAVEVDWQMNRDDLPALSLGTVLRAYLLEHEVARGTRVLFFEGGTPHAMRLYFHLSMVRDLVVARALPGSWWWRKLVPVVRTYVNRKLPQSAFVLKILLEPQLTWRRWG